MTALFDSILELVKSTSTKLPDDVKKVIDQYAAQEEKGSPAKYAMEIVQENIQMAQEKEQPICQDTGSILFFIKFPKGFDQEKFIRTAKDAITRATEKGYLRQNSVDPLTGINSGNNLGPGSPHFHFEQWDKENVDIRLILKGGGCENVGIQYALPYAPLSAQRNMSGVKKCILDAAFKAQGKGCAPGILGVCVGGDRATSYFHTKEQLLRTLDDTNPNESLAKLENDILKEANELEIGPMGFGGKTTILGCKIGSLNRLPASYFVTISYMCWAYRRQGVVLHGEGTIKEWLY